MGQPRRFALCNWGMDRFSADADARNDDELDADDTDNGVHADARVDAAQALDALDAFDGLEMIMRMTRTSPRVLGLRWSFLLVVLISLSPFVQICRADGGIVIFQQALSSFTITLFSTEMPLRPGPVDLSVLLEKNDGHL